MDVRTSSSPASRMITASRYYKTSSEIGEIQQQYVVTGSGALLGGYARVDLNTSYDVTDQYFELNKFFTRP